jgi:ribosomal protein L11 methyltransferase
MEAEGKRVWHALEVTAEPQARESIEYALMEAGALGTEAVDEGVESARITAYFDAVPDREALRAALLIALRIYGLPSSAVREIVSREIADRDWLGEWKKGWQPTRAGRRFLIAPPWSEIAEDDEHRIIIRIEPGMAFGTGTHETTRLCLAAIEKYFTGGSFLDVGTGTGILAIAAAKLHRTARIEACDTDPEAVEIARENAVLNEVEGRIDFRVGTIDEVTRSADFVCANLTADVIAPLLPALVGATCGRLVLSGILDSQRELIMARLHDSGITTPHEVLSDGEWIAIVI